MSDVERGWILTSDEEASHLSALLKRGSKKEVTSGFCFTARRYASAVLAVVVCVSLAGIVSKQLHRPTASRKQCHTIALSLIHI